MTTDLRARLADAIYAELDEHDYEDDDEKRGQVAHHFVDVLLSLPGIAIVELPEPDSDDEWDGQDTGWWIGTRIPEGRIPTAVLRHTLHPNAARRFAAALLAAASAAEATESL